MRYYLSIITVFALAVIVWAETPVSGVVKGRWTRDESPYRVTGDITVEKGSMLWIEPEVDVLFDGPYTLTVDGRLVVGEKKHHVLRFSLGDGKKGEPSVRFTTDLAKNPAGWGGIVFNHPSRENELLNCEISHARSKDNGGGVRSNKSEISIVNCRFSDCTTEGSGGALAMEGGEASITNCDFISNRATGTGGGIYVSNGDASITNGTISLNSDGAVYLWHSEATITNVDVTGNRGAAITMLDKSEAVLTNCTVEDHTGAGIICRDSQFVGTNTTIKCDKETAASFFDNSEAVLTNATLKGGKGMEKDSTSQVVAVNVEY